MARAVRGHRRSVIAGLERLERLTVGREERTAYAEPNHPSRPPFQSHVDPHRLREFDHERCIGNRSPFCGHASFKSVLGGMPRRPVAKSPVDFSIQVTRPSCINTSTPREVYKPSVYPRT